MKRPLCIFSLVFCILFAGVMYFIPLPVYYYENGQWLLGTGTIVCQQNRENQTILIIEQVNVTEMSNHNKQFILSYLSNQSNSNEILLSKKEINSAMEKIPTEKIHMNVKLYQKYEREYSPGQRIVFYGKYKAFAQATNPGMFDQKKYENSCGIGFMLTDVSIMAHSRDGSILKACLMVLKAKCKKVYERYLEEQSEIMCAMILGERWNVDADVKNLYQQSGMIHLLSISSLHITFLGMFILKICQLCHLNKTIQITTTVWFLVLYAILCGTSPSTLRALFMFLILLFSRCIDRTYDVLSALALSFVALLIFQPFYIYHTGFWLSFMAVLGISLLYPVFCNKKEDNSKNILKRIGYLIRNTFLGSFCVTLSICPILLNGYYELATYSILWNLFVIPAMSVVLCSGFVGGIFGVCFPKSSCTYYFLFPGKILLESFERLSGWQSNLIGAKWIIGKPHLWQIILYYSIFLFVIVFFYLAKNLQKKNVVKTANNAKKRRIKRIQYIVVNAGILALFLVLLVPIQIEKTNRVSVTMLDVGQGDCFVIQLNGKVFLVDGGSSSEKEIAKYIIEPFLKSQGISTVDLCFVSHSDMDHMNGIMDCLENQKESGITYKGVCLTTCAQNKQKEYEKIVQTIKDYQERLIYISQGDSIVVDGCKLECIWPKKECNELDENDCSMVLVLEYKDFNMLFLGDASRDVEKKLYLPTKVDILKVSHHGSKTGSGKEFIEKINPQVALISCGKKNRYGHPHEITLDTLNKYGVKVFRTDEKGAIIVDFSHGTILE